MKMALYEELFADICAKNRVHLSFPDLDVDLETLTEQTRYQLLLEIQKVIQDDSLDDPECFIRIEKIVTLFGRHGLSAGSRHDE